MSDSESIPEVGPEGVADLNLTMTSSGMSSDVESWTVVDKPEEELSDQEGNTEIN